MERLAGFLQLVYLDSLNGEASLWFVAERNCPTFCSAACCGIGHIRLAYSAVAEQRIEGTSSGCKRNNGRTTEFSSASAVTRIELMVTVL